MSVHAHAHDLPLRRPHAITNDPIPRAVAMPVITHIKIPPVLSIVEAPSTIPIEPNMTLANAANPIIIIPDKACKATSIVTPVGLTLVLAEFRTAVPEGEDMSGVDTDSTVCLTLEDFTLMVGEVLVLDFFVGIWLKYSLAFDLNM